MPCWSPAPPACCSGCGTGLGFSLTLTSVVPNSYYFIAVAPRAATGWTNNGLRLVMRMQRPSPPPPPPAVV